MKLQQKEIYHNSQSAIHRAVHLIIERVLLNPVSSTKEMKLSINEIVRSHMLTLFIYFSYTLLCST